MKRTIYIISFLIIAATVLTCYGNIPRVMGFSKNHTFSDTAIIGAQPDIRLARYIKELKDFNIDIKVPKGYRSIDMRGRNDIMTNIKDGKYVVSPVMDHIMVSLESENNDAVMCFPNIIYGDSANVIRMASNIAFEIRQYYNKNGDDTFGNDTMDVTPYVKVIAQDDMSMYAEADTVMVYDLKLQNAFLNQYPYMLGVYLRKKCFPALALKIALTDESYKEKDKYLQLLLDNISYGDKPAEYLVRAEELTAKQGWHDRLK